MAEASFVIDGAEYPIPGLETFNMDEAQLLYECCGLTLEDFAIDDADPDQVDELDGKTRNPGFIKALMIVAYSRGNPKAGKKHVVSLIGNSNLFEALQAFVGQDEVEDPTEPQKSEQSTPSSPESSDSNGSSSGDDSETSSGLQEEIPGLTGTSA